MLKSSDIFFCRMCYECAPDWEGTEDILAKNIALTLAFRVKLDQQVLAVTPAT